MGPLEGSDQLAVAAANKGQTRSSISTARHVPRPPQRPAWMQLKSLRPAFAADLCTSGGAFIECGRLMRHNLGFRLPRTSAAGASHRALGGRPRATLQLQRWGRSGGTSPSNVLPVSHQKKVAGEPRNPNATSLAATAELTDGDELLLGSCMTPLRVSLSTPQHTSGGASCMLHAIYPIRPTSLLVLASHRAAGRHPTGHRP